MDQVMEYVEVQAFKGSHTVYFKPTGEVLDIFMNRWEAMRAARAVEKALQSMRMAGTRKDMRCL